MGCLKLMLLRDGLISEQTLSVNLETFEVLFLGKTSPLHYNVINKLFIRKSVDA